MENIFWSDTPLLEAVGEHEPAVEELRDAVKNAIQKALIPLEAYAHEYERYLDLMNIDIHQYVKYLFFMHIYNIILWSMCMISLSFYDLFITLHE